MEDKEYDELILKITEDRNHIKNLGSDLRRLNFEILLATLVIVSSFFLLEVEIDRNNTMIQQLSKQVNNLSCICDSLKSQKPENK